MLSLVECRRDETPSDHTHRTLRCLLLYQWQQQRASHAAATRHQLPAELSWARCRSIPWFWDWRSLAAEVLARRGGWCHTRLAIGAAWTAAILSTRTQTADGRGSSCSGCCLFRTTLGRQRRRRWPTVICRRARRRVMLCCASTQQQVCFVECSRPAMVSYRQVVHSGHSWSQSVRPPTSRRVASPVLQGAFSLSVCEGLQQLSLRPALITAHSTQHYSVVETTWCVSQLIKQRSKLRGSRSFTARCDMWHCSCLGCH